MFFFFSKKKSKINLDKTFFLFLLLTIFFILVFFSPIFLYALREKWEKNLFFQKKKKNITKKHKSSLLSFYFFISCFDFPVFFQHGQKKKNLKHLKKRWWLRFSKFKIFKKKRKVFVFPEKKNPFQKNVSSSLILRRSLPRCCRCCLYSNHLYQRSQEWQLRYRRSTL